MKKQDARSLPGKAQEDLRRRVVEAVRKGLLQTQATHVFGVARPTVTRWMGLVEAGGVRALRARRRGRPPVARLAPQHAARTVRLIVSRCPDQWSLPFALWTREAVQQLLVRWWPPYPVAHICLPFGKCDRAFPIASPMN